MSIDSVTRWFPHYRGELLAHLSSMRSLDAFLIFPLVGTVVTFREHAAIFEEDSVTGRVYQINKKNFFDLQATFSTL